MTNPTQRVDYKNAARRHYKDAEFLHKEKRFENAGQLYGFNAECGLKALLVVHGVNTDQDGNILRSTGYREHMPKLVQLVLALSLFPDGRTASRWMAQMSNLNNFADWHIDHRYWSASSLPLASIDNWRAAAREIEAMLDMAVVDGVI